MRGVWVAVFSLAGSLGGCRTSRPVPPRVRPAAPAPPPSKPQEHWNRAKHLAREGRCGAAVFHLALALRVGKGAGRAWTRVPALVACVEKLSPPAVPKAKRAGGLRGPTTALWVSRLPVTEGPALLGMDPRARAAWEAWGGPAWSPLGREPVRTVRVSAFWIGSHEVTVGEWNACVAAGRCRGRRKGDPMLPVRAVGPDAASAYCRWQRGRLPTRAEWVRAARGESPVPALYPWGDWWSGDCARIATGEGPAHVGTHPCDVSPFGLADMGGNVAELVVERGQSGGRFLVQGASWADSGRWALVAAARPLSQSLEHVGFRCVWDAR